MNASAGGQDEQPSEVNSSTTIGAGTVVRITGAYSCFGATAPRLGLSGAASPGDAGSTSDCPRRGALPSSAPAWAQAGAAPARRAQGHQSQAGNSGASPHDSRMDMP